jgi:hypothetical protein
MTTYGAPESCIRVRLMKKVCWPKRICEFAENFDSVPQDHASCHVLRRPPVAGTRWQMQKLTRPQLCGGVSCHRRATGRDRPHYRFQAAKDKCKGWLDEHWDHAFLLWERDENALAAVRACDPHRIYELPYNPTAENLARYLLHEVCPTLLEGTGATAQRIVIWESEESYAEVSLDSPAGSQGRTSWAASVS